MDDLSRFDHLIKRSKEKKKPRPDIKQAFAEFEEYRRRRSPLDEESAKPEKPKKPKQPDEDFL